MVPGRAPGPALPPRRPMTPAAAPLSTGPGGRFSSSVFLRRSLRSGYFSFSISKPTRSVLCPLHSTAHGSHFYFSPALPVLPEAFRLAGARVPSPLAGGCGFPPGSLTAPCGIPGLPPASVRSLR